MWRKVPPLEKKQYGLQAKFLREINSEPDEQLERSSTMAKYDEKISTTLSRTKSF